MLRGCSARLGSVVEWFPRALRDRRGVAAVEFALLLPLMLLMYIGASDVTRGVIASRDVDVLSRTISDLIAQKNSANALQQSDIQTIFTTASAVMVPFSTTNLTLTVSAVDITANGSTCCQVLVRWSYAQGTTPRACGTLSPVSPGTAPAATNIPQAIIDANKSAGYNYTGPGAQNSYLIVADVTYIYTPYFSQAVSWFLSGIRKTTFMVPRSVSSPINVGTLTNATVNGQAQSGQSCNLGPSQ